MNTESMNDNSMQSHSSAEHRAVTPLSAGFAGSVHHDSTRDDCTVIIFAKAPLPGMAKTRLAPALGEAGAARLAQRMLDETLARAAEAGIGALELCCTPDTDDAILIDAANRVGATLTSQGTGDLGQRMERALHRHLSSGRRAILIGTDCPALDARLLRQAEQWLRQRPAVFAPTADGGYVLVGLSTGIPGLFDQIDWGSAMVMAQTRERLARLHLEAGLLAVLHDIDEPADLVHVPTGWLE